MIVANTVFWVKDVVQSMLLLKMELSTCYTDSKIQVNTKPLPPHFCIEPPLSSWFVSVEPPSSTTDNFASL